MALATAAISMADLVPSMKELNICGLNPPASTCSSVNPTCSHTVSGADAWHSASYLVPLPAQTTSKPVALAQSTISQMRAGWSP